MSHRCKVYMVCLCVVNYVHMMVSRFSSENQAMVALLFMTLTFIHNVLCSLFSEPLLYAGSGLPQSHF